MGKFWRCSMSQSVVLKYRTCEVHAAKPRNGESERSLVFVAVDQSFISSDNRNSVLRFSP